MRSSISSYTMRFTIHPPTKAISCIPSHSGIEIKYCMIYFWGIKGSSISPCRTINSCINIVKTFIPKKSRHTSYRRRNSIITCTTQCWRCSTRYFCIFVNLSCISTIGTVFITILSCTNFSCNI